MEFIYDHTFLCGGVTPENFMSPHYHLSICNIYYLFMILKNNCSVPITLIYFSVITINVSVYMVHIQCISGEAQHLFLEIYHCVIINVFFFRCSACDVTLSSWYFEKDGLLFCKNDYWKKYGEACQDCGQVSFCVAITDFVVNPVHYMNVIKT